MIQTHCHDCGGMPAELDEAGMPRDRSGANPLIEKELEGEGVQAPVRESPVDFRAEMVRGESVEGKKCEQYRFPMYNVAQASAEGTCSLCRSKATSLKVMCP